MALSKLEQHVLAFYLATDAKGVFVNDKYYKRHEFVKIFEESVLFSTKVFGERVSECAGAVASSLVDTLVDKNGLVVTNDKYSGESVKFNIANYKKVVQSLIDENAILNDGLPADADAWKNIFSELAADSAR